jgi:DNA (cytosine-5)-methyltransferase 1
MSAMFTVHDAAAKMGVSADTIRRWEKKGLIKSTRDEKNYRVFKIDEIKRLLNKLSGTDNTKSRYKILKAKKKSRLTCIDLFAGAGGTALGMENAGIQHIMLNEYDKYAAQTLRNNRPNWRVLQDDIRNVDFKPYKGVDIIEGGFPCQSFSYAGKKMGFEDTRGTMFYEFARAVKEAQPRLAIGENVKGLLTHDNGRTLETMVQILEDLGYRVKYRVWRSQYFNVPQKRERLVIFALRNDIKNEITFPDENDYTISIKEAFENCPESSGQEYSDYKRSIMKLVPPGGYWRDLPLDLQKEYMKASFGQGGGKTGMARRLSWDEPSLTLTCNPAQKQTERCHPSETRPLNVREYARIQTFPDEWEFSGSVSQQYKQIGNAVPVNLGFYLGKTARELLGEPVQQFSPTKIENITTQKQLQLLPA